MNKDSPAAIAGNLDINNTNKRKFTIFAFVATSFILGNSINLAFGDEIRHQNGTRIIYLDPVNPPINDIKKHIMKEFEDMIRKTWLDD